MTRADELAAEYLMRPLENPPRFLNSPPVQDGPDRVSPLEAVAGFAVVALVAIIWAVFA